MLFALSTILSTRELNMQCVTERYCNQSTEAGKDYRREISFEDEIEEIRKNKPNSKVEMDDIDDLFSIN